MRISDWSSDVLFRSVHQRSQDLVAPANPRDPAWQKLAEIAGRVEGTIRDHPEIRWREGAALRLEWADERLWLLVDPRVVFDGVTNENKAFAADFARERTAQRYNQKIDKLVALDRKRVVEGKSGPVRLNIGGRRNIK